MMEKAERARNIGTKLFRVLGSDDSVHTCDCCGKSNLKVTFAIEMIETGEILRYGSVCVTRNTGRKKGELNRMKEAYEMERIKAAQAEYAIRPERAAYAAKMNEARQAGLIGVSFMEFCKIEREADKAVYTEIAARHNVHPSKIW